MSLAIPETAELREIRELSECLAASLELSREQWAAERARIKAEEDARAHATAHATNSHIAELRRAVPWIGDSYGERLADRLGVRTLGELHDLIDEMERQRSASETPLGRCDDYEPLWTLDDSAALIEARALAALPREPRP